MTDKKTSNIVQLQDGSIDYRYYAARGMMARNRELKNIAGKFPGASRSKTHALPTLLTIVLLVLIL
jgi:hypothetical protein